MSELIDRLRKLRTMAEQGATEGERAAARTLTERLMAQHGLSDADLEPQERLVRVAVRTRNRHGLTVAAQAYRKMFNATGSITIWDSQKPGYHIFEVPESAKGDFEKYASDHVKSFFAFVDGQMAALVSGYVQANDLYPADGEVSYVNTDEMTGEELLRWAMRQAASKSAPRLAAPKNRQIAQKGA